MCKPVGDTERSALQDALRKVSVFSLLGVCPVVAMLLPWISSASGTRRRPGLERIEKML